MGFLKHFRSRSRLKDQPKPSQSPRRVQQYPVRYGEDLTKKLDNHPDILRRIFTFVCPHCQDESYEPSERSMVGDGCMLCDLRDLASCSAVKRGWYGVAQDLL